MLKNFWKLISNYSLYSFRDALPELSKLCFESDRLPLEFATIPEPVPKALNIVPLEAPRVAVTELDKDGNVVLQPDSQPTSKTWYRKRSLLFSVAGWGEPKLGVKGRRPKEKNTTYADNTVMYRKMETSPLETGADAGLQEKNGKIL